ncbi:hypothetical protein EDB84DRAFT_91813 [Lactarius hengduanensis]|nr:hypothetical protein EDB84DRAFT_91813 [Lactarius hengduanensis]
MPNPPKVCHAIGWGILAFFLFIPTLPLPPILSYCTGFGNGFDSHGGSLGDMGYQASESQGRGQWQFSGIGNAAGARQHASAHKQYRIEETAPEPDDAGARLRPRVGQRLGGNPYPINTIGM